MRPVISLPFAIQREASCTGPITLAIGPFFLVCLSSCPPSERWDYYLAVGASQPAKNMALAPPADLPLRNTPPTRTKSKSKSKSKRGPPAPGAWPKPPSSSRHCQALSPPGANRARPCLASQRRRARSFAGCCARRAAATLPPRAPAPAAHGPGTILTHTRPAATPAPPRRNPPEQRRAPHSPGPAAPKQTPSPKPRHAPALPPCLPPPCESRTGAPRSPRIADSRQQPGRSSPTRKKRGPAAPEKSLQHAAFRR
ncbi:synapsin-1-like [Strigops habroptila]|uniref:synapsin-1-like n=1 Tax=Strigops habroptila TaxID=2489341 RepID=UPI0011CF3275|nr:synapsin-1-like [Strigops habroptila]